MKLHLVPPLQGLTWVRQGVRVFVRQPLALSGLFIMYLACATLLSMLPVVGSFLALALVPAFSLGLMAATQEATRGKFPAPTVLLSAFRAGQQRLRDMLILGAFYVVACLLVTFVAGVLSPLPVSDEAMTLEQLLMSDAFRWHYLTTLALYLPVTLMFWHAPALVHWYGVAPVKSLFFSLTACWRNKAAMVIYGLGWLGIFFLAGLMLTVLAALTGSQAVLDVAVLPTALFVAAMFFASVYFSFRDSFLLDELIVSPPT